MKASTKSYLLNRVMVAALLSGLAMQGSLAANPTVPVFQGQLLLEPVLDNTKCLTAASNADGAAVTLQGCTGAQSQLWTFDNGAVKVHGNKCLDVTGGSQNNGNHLQIWTCGNGNPNQSWDYDIWGNRLVWHTHTNKCADLSAGNTADGTPVQLWDCVWNSNQVWNTGYMSNALPHQSQQDQTGYNDCGAGSSDSSMCQTAWINSADDFCLWAPPSVGEIGATEENEVAWCTKSGRGTRVMPEGTLSGVHFVETPDYVQITGVGDFTKINVAKGDEGGELDNRGATGKGNPIGGLLYGSTFGNNMQYHEWTNFMSDTQFCFRACKGPKATQLCNHIYDEMGCEWNMPANYSPNQVEQCKGNDAYVALLPTLLLQAHNMQSIAFSEPMGIYTTGTFIGTFHQGDKTTPGPHPAPSSSECTTLPSITPSAAQTKRGNRRN
ncbi:hypothetical protein NP233_g4761 [Leucocoprinus birnbaumii]|uniref:Ricin B lectin domain-containing protein n=1 Tax=Leucocoprinus birnbaumii TaxID=56174 RepID=A0AAD5W0J2_9AGAR|nr:hypothetical protein NP233_g4761 [Leucocoprinus birnbaumii]